MKTDTLRGADGRAPRRAIAEVSVNSAVARNAPCPCGSRRRFKDCCGRVLPAEQAEQLQRALALQQEGRLTEAQEVYQQVLDRDPNTADALHMLGVIELQVGNYAEALWLLRRAADLFGWRLPAVRHNLGLAIAALLSGRGLSETQQLWEAYDRWRDTLRREHRDVAVRISVVIPSYNHAQYIDAALESVFRQTYSAAELIVIDDGSCDGSVDRIRASLRRCPCPARFHRRDNRGTAATINEAVALSTGDFVNVLNSDDRFAPTRLAAMADAVSRSGALWGFSRVALIDPTAAGLAPGASARASELCYRTDDIGAHDSVGLACLCSNPAISSGALFFARSLFDRIGGFRESRYNHDWDFCLRASLVAEPVFVPSPQYEYRIHERNTILESALGAKREADAMFSEFYRVALKMQFATNPFAPVPVVWGARFFALVLGFGHAALLPPEVLRDLADRAAALGADPRA